MVNPCIVVGDKKPQLGLVKKLGPCIGRRNRFMTFPEYEWGTRYNSRLSIDASEVVKHDVKHTQIIWKQTKFYAHVDSYIYSQMAPK